MPDSYISPVSILAILFSKPRAFPNLTLITGKIGAGKTSWCQELAYQARLAGFSPVGVVSPGVFKDGEKIGIDLIDLESEERRNLAIRRSGIGGWSESAETAETDDWRFDPTVLVWANRILLNLSGSDLLIIDELGPLEFTKKAGLRSGMSLIDSQDYQHAFVVVRPVLLPAAQTRWPWAQVQDITRTLKPLGQAA